MVKIMLGKIVKATNLNFFPPKINMIYIAILLLLGKVVSQIADSFIFVNPDTNMLTDSFGRERFFHGTNVVVKHYPFHPETSGFSDDTFSEEDMNILQRYGLNSIRLGNAS